MNMSKVPIALVVLLSTAAVASAEEFAIHQFKKIQLTDKFWAEGATFGDFNHDGKMDVVSGPYWYEGPDFKNRHEYSPATHTFKLKKDDGSEETIPGFEGALGKNNTYSDNFFAFTYDFNRDGWADILIIGFPGAETSWYENPRGREGHWQRHIVFETTDNESPTFEDITGDGKPEIICNSGGHFGYVEADWNDPARPWKFHAVSPKGPWERFTHGIGIGDVNGDGKKDILDKDGWWEQPASLAGDQPWKRHAAMFGNPKAPVGQGGAQIYVYDVNGDGRNDVISSIAAHGYGLAWFENMNENGETHFKEHRFMNQEPSENKYGIQFSQLHALDLVDMDGDGLKDIVTGKRFWAHGAHGDADPSGQAVLYWFKLVRGPDHSVDFVPYLIDNDSGVGTQVVVGDVNADRLPDIVVGNKKGVFVLIHEKKIVSEQEWKKAQPKLYNPAEKKTTELTRPGIRPLGLNGKLLNLDFEAGTLADWTADGNAFFRQPIRGDTVAHRRGDMKSRHEGQYWIGTYEIYGDDAEGTLTSAPFKVVHPFASFLIAGGHLPETRVELVRNDTKNVFFKASGYDSENLRPVVVDLRDQIGKEIFIRLVDQRKGAWAHINFDDFKFHDQKPEFKDALQLADFSLEKIPAPQPMKFAGLSPEEAAKEMVLPPGFSAKLFAGEPDVKQPIAFAIDDRGRLWVAEAYTYPRRAPEGQGQDRILIFEDANGDGRFDKQTVFAENLNLVSGLEVGFGGVWVGAAPNLMFIPDRNGDDKPDGPPEVLLDGWAYQDTHETLNTFTWGPDGWLYGCHGIFTHSNVGKPGAPDSERAKINGGIWRYHPIQHRFEVFAEGTSNPWGIDFDANGQAFIEACVIPHLFHIVQGARYTRQAGQHFNPYTYDDIRTVADHLHYRGNQWNDNDRSSSGSLGGGHAHAGMLVYQGRSWPEQYWGKLFMNNIHGSRINMDVPERSGSSFVCRHGADLINFNDTWSQIINLQSDQDGSVYMIDWYDKNQCHHNDVNGHDRTNGRIFKIVYNNQKFTPVDLSKKSDAELVDLQLNPNEWYVRHARRLLQERAARHALQNGTVARLETMLQKNSDPSRQLRALWALDATGELKETTALAALSNPSEYIRGWAIQFLAETKNPSDSALKEFVHLAKTDPSPVVRLYLAAALQRTPVEKRWNVLTGLVAHAEDANDHNLPLMYWYAAEPGVGKDSSHAIILLSQSKIPRVREFITRRMAASQKVATAK